MASPSVFSQTPTTSTGVTDTSHPVTMPSHAAGDILLVDAIFDGNPNVTVNSGSSSAGWDIEWNLKNTTGGTTPTSVGLSLLATGASETLVLTSDVGEASQITVRVIRGSGGTLNVFAATPVSGSSANGTGPAIAPGAGSQDMLYCLSYGQDGVAHASAGPSGYSNFVGTSNPTASRVDLATCEKAATASSSDTPGAWTAAAEQWIAGAWVVWETAGGSGPTITQQPENATRLEGQTAVFSVAATGTGTLSYQWQVDTGGGFANVSTGSGGTTDEYTTDTLSESDDGSEYRCVVTDDDGSTNSAAALLTIHDGTLLFVDETTGGVDVAIDEIEVAAIDMAAGDIDLLVIGAGEISAPSSPGITTPTGFTKVDEAVNLPLATVVNTTVCVFWRYADGPSAPVAVVADVDSLWGWTRISYRYPHPTDPFEFTEVDHLAASTEHVLPGYSAAQTATMYLGWVSQAIAQGGTVTPPMILRINDEAGGIVLGEEQIAAIGATGTRSIDVTDSADTVYAVIGLRSLISEGGQTVSPPLLTNGQTFFSPTVQPGGVNLAPGLLTNAQTFYSPTVSPSAVSLDPGLLTNTVTLYAPVVSVGGVSLSPGLVENGQTFYGPTITTGVVAVAPPLLENEQTFHAPMVSVGAVTISPPLLTNANEIFDPVVGSGAVVQPPLLTNSQTFFAPAVTAGAVELLPPLLANEAIFYGPTVSAGSVIEPPLLTNSTVLYAPVVSVGGVALAPSLLTNAVQIFAPMVTQEGEEQFLLPALFTNTSTFYAPTIALVPADIEIDERFIARPEPRNWTATNTPRNWEART